MVLPATAILIAAAVNAAAKAGKGAMAASNEKKKGKLKAKETKRETFGNLYKDAMARSADLEAHRLAMGNKRSKNRSRTSQDTAELVRGALNI